MIDDRFFRRLERTLATRARRKLVRGDWVPSAVLVPLFVEGGSLRLLLTERSERLTHHAGQISFPGGVIDAADPSPLDAALREAEEEVGLSPTDVDVVGRLDDTFTGNRFKISPFVGRIERPSGTFNPGEIARVLTPRLDEFCRGDNLRHEEREFDGRKVRLSFYDLEEGTVWGATARLIEMLLEEARRSGWESS